MNDLSTQLKIDDLQREENDESPVLTAAELALVGGGECVLNGI